MTAKDPKNQAGSHARGRQHVHDASEVVSRMYGDSRVAPLALARVADIQRLPFGLMYLDWITRGGAPIGRLTRLWGPKSALKTTTCLKLCASAMRTCRYCKYPLVVRPDTGEQDCRCPNPRWTISDSKYYHWLTQAQAIQIADGMLPDGAYEEGKGKNKSYHLDVKRPEKSKVAADAKEAAQRKLTLVEAYRCEPMRVLYLDSERTLDRKWVERNGVDPALVSIVGPKWAEDTFDTLDDLLALREDDTSNPVFDLVVIDSLSMLTPKDRLEKNTEERPTVAGAANVMKRWFEKCLYRMHEQGLHSNMAPTILLTSQVSTHGIGGPFTWLAPANGLMAEHVLILDIKCIPVDYTMLRNDVALSGSFQFNITKNKGGGSPEAKCVVEYQMVDYQGRGPGDSDDFDTTVSVALEHGVSLERGKSKITFTTPYAAEPLDFKTQTALKEWLTANPSAYADLRRRVLDYVIENHIALPAQTLKGGIKKDVLEKVSAKDFFKQRAEVDINIDAALPKAKESVTSSDAAAAEGAATTDEDDIAFDLGDDDE